MAEFDLIAQYFTRPGTADVSNPDLGIGDDAALISVMPGYQLAVSADMSVSGTHFFAEADPYSIGWKALAVNISDMAAMGANPKWATLSIALPEINHDWLQGFSQGLFACADNYGVLVIGGDTTRGPLNIAINILGEVPLGKAIKRSGAQVGDDIWVSGTLGKAALWLQNKLGKLDLHAEDVANFAPAMHQPQPRVTLGLALRDIAHTALDISDGLLADLNHILQASGKGAELDWALFSKPQLVNNIAQSVLQQAVLAGGDDYELCFTVSAQRRDEVLALSDKLNLPLTRIGSITEATGLNVTDGEVQIELSQKGYLHFG
ncbi:MULTISPECIES: thiamine-phosphate kinase [unclassified Methylophilus]|uniref:thiamine-phosphate kinase n=1 Tax=unclassified Methylophilus TaxID=2630143 RepID=UPI0006F73870|nr:MULTISPECIES: thiamine-phosphate kinase [unclassified Methylophilus]KQT43692.1 thiamine monophosphate kinase [Methylophilus sp. Leaf416]KQT59178.1 thiamine monophosphate kinase [Methylophilus sp. Leaf459]